LEFDLMLSQLFPESRHGLHIEALIAHHKSPFGSLELFGHLPDHFFFFLFVQRPITPSSAHDPDIQDGHQKQGTLMINRFSPVSAGWNLRSIKPFTALRAATHPLSSTARPFFVTLCFFSRTRSE
jgi:hypothetical protein